MIHLTLNPALARNPNSEVPNGTARNACMLEIYTLFVSTENELESNMADSIETGG